VRLVFLHGPVASGKLTIGRLLAERTGYALFHNHLIVDAVGAVFPFGSEAFVRLRERFWLETMAEAAAARRSLIFTFAPEPTVRPGFADRARAVVEAGGGGVVFVALTLPPAEQERRLVDPGRAAFGKMRSVALLRSLRDAFDASAAAMPAPRLTIDTAVATPEAAAEAIAAALAG
jgi:hypothetical protein